MSSVDKSAPPPGQVVGPPPDYSANQAPPAGYSGQQSSVVVMQQPAVFGACAACGRGYPREEYTVCGIILALCFFPLGIICCMMMTERRCTNCGALC